MVIVKRGIGASVAALMLGAVLLAGCGDGGSHPEAPGELIHQKTRGEGPTSVRAADAPGVSHAPSQRA